MKKRGRRKIIRFLPLILLISLVAVFFIQSQFKQTGNIAESSQSEKSTAYIYGNGLVASYDSDGNEKYYINDHLGGTSIVLDENGNKISEESYYAFGEERAGGDSRFTYTGKEKDDSGLYYYGARYYDADSGRFLQPDPISGSLGNPQSLNKYVYVLNNPLKYTDPSGMAETIHTMTSGEISEKLADPFDFLDSVVYGTSDTTYAIDSDSLKQAVSLSGNGNLIKNFRSLSQIFYGANLNPGESFEFKFKTKSEASFSIELSEIFTLRLEVPEKIKIKLLFADKENEDSLVKREAGYVKFGGGNPTSSLFSGFAKVFGGAIGKSIPKVEKADYLITLDDGYYWQAFQAKKGELAPLGPIKDYNFDDAKFEDMTESEQTRYNSLIDKAKEDLKKSSNQK